MLEKKWCYQCDRYRKYDSWQNFNNNSFSNTKHFVLWARGQGQGLEMLRLIFYRFYIVFHVRPRPRTTVKAKDWGPAKAKDLDFGLNDQDQGQGQTSLPIWRICEPKSLSQWIRRERCSTREEITGNWQLCSNQLMRCQWWSHFKLDWSNLFGLWYFAGCCRSPFYGCMLTIELLKQKRSSVMLRSLTTSLCRTRYWHNLQAQLTQWTAMAKRPRTMAQRKEESW